MAGDATHPSQTVTRKPDDDVGEQGTDATGGGKQTAQQAAITGMDNGGRDDADRRDAWSESEGGDKGTAGRGAPPVGGASQGHSERKNADRSSEAGSARDPAMGNTGDE